MQTVIFFACITLLHACIVRAPKATRAEYVAQLKMGMNQGQVDSTLRVKAYTIKMSDTSGHVTLKYKFRAIERKTLSFTLKDTNGKDVRGPFMDLFAYFDEKHILYKIETADSDEAVEEKKVNFDKIVTFFTVTAPAVAVAIGLSKADDGD